MVRFGHDPATAFTSWLFANCGAQVIVPEDHSTVAWTRLRRGFLRTGSRTASREALIAASADADVVLTDATGWHPEPAGAASLIGHVEPVSPDSPYRDWSLAELELVALGGAADFTRDEDGTPLYGGGQRYAHLSGLLLFIALVAEAHAGLPPRLRRITVRGLEVVTYCLPYPTLQFAYNGGTETFEQSGPRFVLRCRDGWAAVYAGADWSSLAALLGGGDLLEDRRFVGPEQRFANADELGLLLSAWARERSLDEAIAEAQEHSVALAKIRSIAEVMDDPHLVAAEAWQAVVVDGRSGRGPRLPWKIDGRRPRPRQAGAAPPRWPRRRDDGRALPLAGIRVVDLTQVWSGPMASRVLAALGAEIAKVEGPTRFDFLRGSGRTDVVRRYPNRDPGASPRDRNAWFNTQNVDKRSVLLDLKSERGRELALALVNVADVLLSNFRPGVVERLGLGPDQARALRPELVHTQMPGYGDTGPYRDMAAYGAQFEAHSGAVVWAEPNRPVLTGYAMSDPVAGLAGAAATVVALARRTRTGDGAEVEAPQYEAMLALIGEAFVAASLDSEISVPRNGSPEASFHGIYRLGSGRHITVRADGPDELRALGAAVGAEDPADPDVVAAAVEAFCARVTDHGELAAKLQAAEIAVAPVQRADEVFHDAELRGAGFYVALDHPAAGRFEHPGFPLLRDGVRVAPRNAAPVLGQHTDEVLREWLDLPADARQAARDSGVIA